MLVLRRYVLDLSLETIYENIKLDKNLLSNCAKRETYYSIS